MIFHKFIHIFLDEITVRNIVSFYELYILRLSLFLTYQSFGPTRQTSSVCVRILLSVGCGA